MNDALVILEEEEEMTPLDQTPSGRRWILQMILDLQRPLLNVKLLNKRMV